MSLVLIILYFTIQQAYDPHDGEERLWTLVTSEILLARYWPWTPLYQRVLEHLQQKYNIRLLACDLL